MQHTNRWGLAEDALMKHAGQLLWSAIAETIGQPLSHLRTLDGGEVYATFYFVEDSFPDAAPIEGFQLDDTVRFRLTVRAFKISPSKAESNSTAPSACRRAPPCRRPIASVDPVRQHLHHSSRRQQSAEGRFPGQQGLFPVRSAAQRRKPHAHHARLRRLTGWASFLATGSRRMGQASMRSTQSTPTATPRAGP